MAATIVVCVYNNLHLGLVAGHLAKGQKRRQSNAHQYSKSIQAKSTN